jgi:hypothetical protein
MVRTRCTDGTKGVQSTVEQQTDLYLSDGAQRRGMFRSITIIMIRPKALNFRKKTERAEGEFRTDAVCGEERNRRRRAVSGLSSCVGEAQHLKPPPLSSLFQSVLAVSSTRPGHIPTRTRLTFVALLDVRSRRSIRGATTRGTRLPAARTRLNCALQRASWS